LTLAVSLKDVSFTYLHASKPAIADINLEIETGSVTAIVGQTGAGKSTLLRTLDAIIPKVIPGKLEGDITVAGQNVRQTEPTHMARYINLVLDDPVLQIVSLTVEEDVAFGPANLNLPRDEVWERVSRALAATRLVGYEKRNPRTMSGGEQQLLAIAGILAMRPRIIGLDEPVAMLDPRGKAQVLDVVRELQEKYGTTVMISESGTDIEAVCEFADRMVLMHKGHIIAQGSPDEIFAQRQLVEETKLKVPEVTRAIWQLDQTQGTTVPTTLEQAADYLAKHLPSHSVTQQPREPITRTAQPKKKEPAIIVENLHHVFPGEPPVHALNGIDLTIYKGEMVAILGQNGSGKTTLSYHLVGLEKPTNDDASIIVDGLDVLHAPLSQTIRRINYLFQNPSNQLFCETFGQEVSFGPRQLGLSPEEADERARQALNVVGLEHLWQYYTLGLAKSFETLLSLAAVLAMDSHILISDEPTGGLDHAASEKVMQTLSDLNSQGHTIIIITHDMELAAKYAQRIIVLRHGEVLTDGTPREVFSQTEVLASTQLYPPQITRLAQRLAPYGIPPDILTVEEFSNWARPTTQAI